MHKVPVRVGTQELNDLIGKFPHSRDGKEILILLPKLSPLLNKAVTLTALLDVKYEQANGSDLRWVWGGHRGGSRSTRERCIIDFCIAWSLDLENV